MPHTQCVMACPADSVCILVLQPWHERLEPLGHAGVMMASMCMLVAVATSGRKSMQTALCHNLRACLGQERVCVEGGGRVFHQRQRSVMRRRRAEALLGQGGCAPYRMPLILTEGPNYRAPVIYIFPEDQWVMRRHPYRPSVPLRPRPNTWPAEARGLTGCSRLTSAFPAGHGI
jgi:hypothetical protein